MINMTTRGNTRLSVHQSSVDAFAVEITDSYGFEHEAVLTEAQIKRLADRINTYLHSANSPIKRV